MRRALAVLAGVVLITLGIAGAAQADPTGVCSKTRVLPGDRISVHGKDALPGEWAHLNFNSKTIGGTTVDGYGFWIVGGRIPIHATPGTYQFTVTFQTSNTAAPCFV